MSANFQVVESRNNLISSRQIGKSIVPLHFRAHPPEEEEDTQSPLVIELSESASHILRVQMRQL